MNGKNNLKVGVISKLLCNRGNYPKNSNYNFYIPQKYWTNFIYEI